MLLVPFSLLLLLKAPGQQLLQPRRARSTSAKDGAYHVTVAIDHLQQHILLLLLLQSL